MNALYNITRLSSYFFKNIFIWKPAEADTRAATIYALSCHPPPPSSSLGSQSPFLLLLVVHLFSSARPRGSPPHLPTCSCLPPFPFLPAPTLPPKKRNIKNEYIYLFIWKLKSQKQSEMERDLPPTPSLSRWPQQLGWGKRETKKFIQVSQP